MFAQGFSHNVYNCGLHTQLGDLWNNDSNVTPFEATILVENKPFINDENEITDNVFEKTDVEVSSAEYGRILLGDISGDGEMKEEPGFGEESTGFAQSPSMQPISWASIIRKSSVNPSDENDDVAGSSKAYVAETLHTRINTSLNRVMQTESDYKMKGNQLSEYLTGLILRFCYWR